MTKSLRSLQARRDGGKGGVSFPGPRDIWGPRRRSTMKIWLACLHGERK